MDIQTSNIPSIQSLLGDGNNIPQDVITALENALADLAPLFSTDSNGNPTGIFANLADEIAACSGSQSQMNALFGTIYTDLEKVSSDISSDPNLMNLYVVSTQSTPNTICVGSMLVNLINSFTTALGYPEANGSASGGILAELAGENYEPDANTLSFLTELVAPFSSFTNQPIPQYDQNGNPISGQYPSSWTPSMIQAYQAMWGGATQNCPCFPPWQLGPSLVGIIANALFQISKGDSSCAWMQ